MSVTAPAGFLANGVAAGIKASGDLDLAVVAAAGGAVAAAAVFTTNGAAAAPVLVSRAHLATSGGRVRAVVLNSGCANAATGAAGVQAAEATCATLATELGCRPAEILVCSTGLIGIPLAIDRLLGALPAAVAGLGGGAEEGGRAATAILTTDTHAKTVLVEREGFSVGGMVKGAGMIAPHMATMLCVLTTDAAATPEALDAALRLGVRDSFNELVVDGCTSTNDTVIVLASGAGRAVTDKELAGALAEACADLAGQLAEDAEGTTKVAAIEVRGAASDADARAAGRRVALSLLVKTSLYGADPYWGRVVSELGASGSAFDLDRVSVSYGGIEVCSGGVGIEHDRQAVAAHMAGGRIELRCDLHLGDFSATVLTTDLGHGYIDENMRTS
ncbi:MAG TPA: bifunctional glutamate N-acetyltransferase/amino-acid acetyltransferase ArgJ [Acidimicrobiales bacterium]|nr:bifunctional glutamate N-acetyltransferase/amino-acid acetyltransferase ArgJ [Acidimicrobiales bacterium]